ncbi:MAG: ABC transporter ATP-binding protein [Pseudomonadota bacterium]
MSLEFRHIAHAYGEVTALKDVSFAAQAGEITCLLGASGCGKSTLLGLAAGLLRLQHGSIVLDGGPVAEPNYNPPPEARPIGMVFQDGALFPHMTLAKNVAFGLPKARTNEALNWLERVGLAGLSERYPHELSGGQQQRAALARAMAPEPPVLLLDEPFASVDIVLRRRLRRDCRMLLRERATITVLVTHDPEEALDIADRIAVMDAGRVIQFGTPSDLHAKPVTPAIGAMFGNAEIIPATRHGDHLQSALGTFPVSCMRAPVPHAERLELLLAIDQLDLVPDPAGLLARDHHVIGAITRVVLEPREGSAITVETDAPVSSGQRYRLVPRPASIRAFAKP